jgi:hypothetical protein
MNKAQLQRLVATLAILLLVWGGLRAIRRPASDHPTVFRPPPIDRSAVTEIVLQSSTDTVRLTRSGAGWLANGFPAAANLVAELLSELADSSSSGELVASNRASHSRLGVDSTSARYLTVRAGGKPVIAYRIGKRGSDYASVYLRREGDDNVYEVRGRLGEAADRRLEDWRDKRILALAADSIGSVEIRRGRTVLRATRGDSGWKLGSAPADSGAVADWLGKLASLSATGFGGPQAADSARRSTSHSSIAILNRAGQALARLTLDSIASGFLVRRQDDSILYRLDTWTAGQIMPADTLLTRRTRKP